MQQPWELETAAARAADEPETDTAAAGKVQDNQQADKEKEQRRRATSETLVSEGDDIDAIWAKMNARRRN